MEFGGNLELRLLVKVPLESLHTYQLANLTLFGVVKMVNMFRIEYLYLTDEPIYLKNKLINAGRNVGKSGFESLQIVISTHELRFISPFTDFEPEVHIGYTTSNTCEGKHIVLEIQFSTLTIAVQSPLSTVLNQSTHRATQHLMNYTWNTFSFIVNHA